jgi:hypothetical protein
MPGSPCETMIVGQMAELDDLCASIAATTADYRTAPTAAHVNTWVEQFPDNVRRPILREMDHVLKKTYFSHKRTEKFLAGLFQTEKLVGDDPCGFWKSVKFLDIQGGGASQTKMLALFRKLLEEKCGCTVDDYPVAPNTFVYLDDAIFTGNRLRRDLEEWIVAEAPATAKVHVITIALHRGGQFYAKGCVKTAGQAAGKNLDLTWWRAIEF